MTQNDQRSAGYDTAMRPGHTQTATDNRRLPPERAYKETKKS